MTPLAELPVLLVDAQATAAFPRGALLEVGWATSWPAGRANRPRTGSAPWSWLLPTRPCCRRPWRASPASLAPSGRAGQPSERPGSGSAPRPRPSRPPPSRPSSTSPASRSRSFATCTSATATARSPSASSARTRSRGGSCRSCRAGRCAPSPATSAPVSLPCAAAPSTSRPRRACGVTWSRCSASARESARSTTSTAGSRRRLAAAPARGRSRASGGSSCRPGRASTGCCATGAVSCTSARPPRCGSA